MQIVLVPILNVLSIAIDLYKWAVIVSAVVSWLVAFSVINTHNRFIYTMMDALSRITEPALRPIRQVMPNRGGVDLSPVVLILLLMLIQMMIGQLEMALFSGAM